MNWKKYFEMYTLILVGISMFLCCDDAQKNADKKEDVVKEVVWPINPHFPYNLKKPTIEMKMSLVLKEISGLTYIREKNEIAAINDELGNIYFMDAKTGESKNKIRFDRFGDYEAIEFVNGLFYICNSKGAILEITPGKDVKTEMYKTRLSYYNNVEGMGYNAENNTLVLACKDDGHLKGADKIKGKAFYSYSLDKMLLDRTPLFTVRDKELIKWFSANVGKMNKKITERVSSFSPAGIAIHPISKNYYVVSARGDMLVVFDQAGEVLHIELVRDYIEQIEGVCFDPDGNLYVSSEGVSKKGRIFSYSIIN